MQPPQNPYGQGGLPNPAGGPSFQPAPVGTSSTTTLIVTGILGIICCGFLAPYTWIKSNQALQALNSGYGNIADKGTYNITRILGIIGTVLLILSFIRVGTIVSQGGFNSRQGTTIGAPGIGASGTK